MALEIGISDSANFRKTVTIPTQRRLKLRFKFITRGDTGWVMDITDQEDVKLMSGIRLVSGTSPTAFFSLDEFSSGSFFCLKKTTTNEPLGRDNFGLGKDYGLFYINENEI